MDSDRPRVLSFGGGVQSSALLALLGQGRYPGAAPQEVWFCDPQGERPQTYEWIARVIKPYCIQIGVPFVTLARAQGPVRGPDLMLSHRIRKQYPLRRNRECTVDWKINVMLAESRRRGHDRCAHGRKMVHTRGYWATGRGAEHRCAPLGVEKHLGISLDELHRARTGNGEEEWEHKRYPLIEARLFRDDCARLCQQTWGEVPVKSGCWFCKYQSVSQWRAVWAQRDDGRWDQAVSWEREVLADKLTNHPFIDIRPWRTLEGWAHAWGQGEQLSFESEQEGACDGGFCMT